MKGSIITTPPYFVTFCHTEIYTHCLFLESNSKAYYIPAELQQDISHKRLMSLVIRLSRGNEAVTQCALL